MDRKRLLDKSSFHNRLLDTIHLVIMGSEPGKGVLAILLGERVSSITTVSAILDYACFQLDIIDTGTIAYYRARQY